MSTSAEFLATLREWVEVFMNRSMHGFFLCAKERGFSMSQLGLLMHISRKRVSGIADIGDELGVTSAAVSQMIDRLVQQKLIARTENPDDRRAKRIELTEKGARVVHECTEARQRWLESLSSAMSIEERKLAENGLRLLITRTNELEKDVS